MPLPPKLAGPLQGLEAMPADFTGATKAAAARQPRDPARGRWTRMFGAVLFTLVAVARPGLAEDRRGDWEIGFDAMFIFLGTESFESDLDVGGRLALRAGCYLTNSFQLEAQFSYSRSEGDCALIICRDVDTTMKTRFVNAVFNIDHKKEFKSYLLAGIGQANLDFDGDISAEDEGTAYQAGLGVRSDNRHGGVRFELLIIQDDLFGDHSTHVSFGVGLIFRPGSKL
jgi:hypothetical protein